MALIANTQAAANNAVTTSSINTTGAKLIVLYGSTYVGAVGSMTDSKGNTWTALTRASSGVASGQFYYCINPTAGTGHTFTCTATGFYPRLFVMAFDDTSPIYDTANQAASTTANPQAGSITPAQDGELLIVGTGDNSTATVTVPTSFTSIDAYHADTNFANGTTAYYYQPTAAAINPQWTAASAARAANIVAFKVGGGGATRQQTLSLLGVGV